MTDAQQALAQVREALAAGPTPGEWYANGTVVYLARSGGFDLCDCPRPHANAAFIARCNPENIAAILAHVEAQKAEIKRLRDALNTCVWALRQPLDGWKGECERKALDKARDALKEQR